uniref:Uncharacterized protein n=1 Tax=Arundo donax TaxID=35708 RepID=A0A0A8Z9E6_ARUDO
MNVNGSQVNMSVSRLHLVSVKGLNACITDYMF